MQSFWQSLRKPIFVQAPMEDATDTVFRQIVASCGKPDVFFTEFTSSDALCSVAKDHVIHRFQFTRLERPIVAQIWGNDANHLSEATRLVKQLQFDGIDINMGCPVNKVISNGQCSALINNHKLAAELITSVKDAASDELAVSVKTRIGFNRIVTEEWIGFLLKQNLDALSIHLRTAAERSEVPAHWEEMDKIIKLRDSFSPSTVIIGNGDVKSLHEAKEKCTQYKIDGVMIGREMFQNVWIFNEQIDSQTVPIHERIELLIQHLELFDKTWRNKKPFNIMKKYYKIYISGFNGANQLRIDIMKFKNAKDTIEYLRPL